MKLAALFASMRRSIAADPAQSFQFAFFLFLPAGLLIRPNPVWAWTFYALFVPALFYLIYRQGSASLNSRSAVLALAVCAYYLLSLTWGDASGAVTRKWLMSGVWTVLFIAGGVVFFSNTRSVWERFFDILTAAGAINATISLFIYFTAPPDGHRLVGFAETRHSILGASIIGVCAIATFYRLCFDANRIRRFLRTCCLILFAVFVLLTRSRGPLLALVASALVYSYFVDRKMALASIAVLGVALGLIMLVDPFARLLQEMAARKSYRLDVWTEALEAIRLRPLFGYGLAARFSDDPLMSFPHSLYVSALFYGGITGLLLMLALFGSLVRDLMQSWDPETGPFRLTLFVHTLIVGLTDLGQPVKGPGELWFILWLPITALIGINWRKLRSPVLQGAMAAAK
jgi:O-antigen ligase